MRTAIAIMLICQSFAPCVAQEQDAPKNLIGFLKPGMHIGVVSYGDSDRMTINIYTEQDHAIATDARSMSLEELASKYEGVATELARTRQDFLTKLQSRTENLAPGKEYGEPFACLRLNQGESLYKVTAIGDDYILLTSSVAPTKRRVFAARCISSIDWYDQLPFKWSVPVLDKTTDSTKP